MDFFADIFLGAGALAAAFYCLVLSRKLSKLSGLDQELGTAIAVLSKQVDDMTGVLSAAKETAGQSSMELSQMTTRAEDVAEKLETMLSALENLPDPASMVSDAQDNPDIMTGSSGLGEASSVFLRHSKRTSGDAA